MGCGRFISKYASNRAYEVGLTRSVPSSDFPPTITFCEIAQLRSPTFFNVGDRSWAISQNVMVGGKSLDGTDLVNPTSYALLDAYFEMNLPQPILSVKLHRNTPSALYE